MNSIWPEKLHSETYFTSDPYCRHVILQKKLIKSNFIKCSDYTRTDREKMQKAVDYVQVKYEKFIPILTLKLNAANKVNYSSTFWKKYLSQALIRHITILHDFFTRTENNFFPEEQRFNIISIDSYIFSNTYEDHFELLVSSEIGQEMLFSMYVNLFYPNSQELSVNLDVRTKKINSNEFTDKIKKIYNKTWIFFYHIRLEFKFKLVLLKIYKIITSLFRNRVVVGFIDVFYAEKYQLEILKQGKLKLNFINLLNINFIDTIIDKKIRKQLTNIQFDDLDKFDKYFFYTLQYLLPTSFIENFNQFEIKSEILFSKYPKLKYVVSEGWQSNTFSSFMLAYCSLKNIKHYYSEHNGFFHIYTGNVVDQKSKIVDFYLSTGWNSTKIKNLIPLASLYNYNVKNEIKNVKGFDILYITNSNESRMYQYGGFYSTMEVNAFNHMNLIKSFFNNLDNEVLKKISIRDHPVQYQKKRLCFDKNTFCGNNYIRVNRAVSDYEIGKRAKDQILFSKFVIIDSISTSYLECLFMNIPCIFFLNLNSNFLNFQNNDFFDELIDAKICWTCPIEAAKFVNSIYQNIDLWWTSDKVQSARNNFISINFKKPELAISYYKKLSIS